MKYQILALTWLGLVACSKGTGGPGIPLGDVPQGGVHEPTPSDQGGDAKGQTGEDPTMVIPDDPAIEPTAPEPTDPIPPREEPDPVVVDPPKEEPKPAPEPEPETPKPMLYPASCLEVKQQNAMAQTGVQTIYLKNADGSHQPLSAYCDMNEDGGGWTLILNYLHKGQTNPDLRIKTDDLPLPNSNSLGGDESAMAANFGHAAPSLLGKFAVKELRFYCRTSKHGRILHFKTTDADCLKAATTGQSSCGRLNRAYSPLSGHTATIPATANVVVENKGNQALTDLTFSYGDPNGPDPSWNIRGDNGKSWECDNGSDSEADHTFHQVWFR